MFNGLKRIEIFLDWIQRKLLTVCFTRLYTIDNNLKFKYTTNSVPWLLRKSRFNVTTCSDVETRN